MPLKIKRKIWRLLLVVPVFITAACLSLHGAASSPVWAAADDANAVLYLPDSGEITDCQVGTVSCSDVETTPISELETPVRTLIILDNSLSIPKDQRPLITQLLTNLIGNRMEGEQFTIVTIEDDIHYLCTNESDYLALSSAINGIQYQNQDTQLTDNVYQAIQTLYQESPIQFGRVVIVADGVDDKEIGYTRAELQDLIQTCGYPIYTVGCGPDNTDERTTLLDNLFALSRITSGQSYYFGDTTDTYQIAQGICEYNQAQRVTIRLPAEVCDGTVRGVKVVCGAEVYTTQLMMPFNSPQAGSAPEKKEYAEMERTKTMPVQPMAASGVPIWILISIGAGVLLAAAAAGTLLIRRKRKKKAVQQEQRTEKKVSEVVEIRDNRPSVRHWYDDLPGDSPDKAGDFAADTGENTVQVFGNGAKRAKRLRLVNLKNTSLFYEVTLQGRITVGRSASCQITIDNASVSRTQCEIYQQNGQIYAVNCSQTNPTRIGRTVMDRPMPLKNGTVLTMGKVQMRVEIGG